MGASSKLRIASSADAGQAQRHAVIDEYGELKRKEAAFQPTAQRLKLLRETIAGWIPDSHPADQPLSFSSKLFTVNCSPCQVQRVVSDKRGLFRKLGTMKFIELVSIGVTALENALGEDVATSWLERKRIGPRSISAVANASPEPLKEAA